MNISLFKLPKKNRGFRRGWVINTRISMKTMYWDFYFFEVIVSVEASEKDLISPIFKWESK